MIEVSEQTIDRIHAILAGVEKADEKVLKPALARGLMAGKTAAKKQAVATYRIKPSTFDEETYINYKGVKLETEQVIGSIIFAGRPIPLIKFKVIPNMPQEGKTPSAAVLKANSPTAFDRKGDVTVRQTRKGKIGIFQTRNRGYRELYAPSTPKMLGNEKVMQNIEDRVNEVINQRIEHEIERLLNE